MKRIVDLRSDTFTLPTEAMMESILHARLGNDSHREDPTVIELEELAAKTFGKDSAILTVSGTMSNIIAILAQTERGNEVIMGSESHIYDFEGGQMGAMAGIHPRIVSSSYGVIDPKDVESAIRPLNTSYPQTALVCNENTNNRAGGTLQTVEQMKSVFDVAHAHDLPIHCDGARIFNASIALKKDVKELARYSDSVSVCLSKGLACPMGSLLCGTEELISRARLYRRMLGGVFRQAGVIAAPGIIALKEMVERLEEDHINTRKLAEGLEGHREFSIDMRAVQTNILFLDFKNGMEVKYEARLDEEGIRTYSTVKGKLRMVTHHGISGDDIDYTLEKSSEIFTR